MALPEYKTQKTRNWQKLGDKIPYKSYVALLNQTGGNAPTATVVYNDLGEITYEYNSDGDYLIKSNGLFIENKIFFTVQQTQNNSPVSVNIILSRYDNDTLFLKINVEGTGPSNDWLLNAPIEIRLYN
jgi:hypothetical protein